MSLFFRFSPRRRFDLLFKFAALPHEEEREFLEHNLLSWEELREIALEWLETFEPIGMSPYAVPPSKNTTTELLQE